MGLEIFAKM